MKLTTRSMEVLTEDEMTQIWGAALRVWAQLPLHAPAAEA